MRKDGYHKNFMDIVAQVLSTDYTPLHLLRFIRGKDEEKVCPTACHNEKT